MTYLIRLFRFILTSGIQMMSVSLPKPEQQTVASDFCQASPKTIKFPRVSYTQSLGIVHGNGLCETEKFERIKKETGCTRWFHERTTARIYVNDDDDDDDDLRPKAKLARASLPQTGCAAVKGATRAPNTVRKYFGCLRNGFQQIGSESTRRSAEPRNKKQKCLSPPSPSWELDVQEIQRTGLCLQREKWPNYGDTPEKTRRQVTALVCTALSPMALGNFGKRSSTDSIPMNISVGTRKHPRGV